jgi:hypothetical protein
MGSTSVLTPEEKEHFLSHGWLKYYTPHPS